MASTCLHQVFERQADRTPAATALVCGDRQLTYAELDRRANQLARKLIRHGAKPGGHVAIYCDRSELPVIAVLACHKSGATYVPIDPTNSADRVRHITSQLGIPLCLTDSRMAGPAGELFDGAELVVADGEWPEEDTRIDSGVTPEDLAYVIYTSGPTGKPQGLMTEHRQVTHFIQVFNEECGTSAEDRVYQGFPLSFDGSVEEIWMAFSNGSTLVAPTPDAPRFGDELGGHLADLGITYFSTVPSVLATITTAIPSLRTVVVSGKACPPELVDRWARPGLRILNVYGPAEATGHTTVAECHPERPLTIGRPLQGYHVDIVDEDLHLVEPGSKGELLISGKTLARGYVKQPGLTAQRFLYSEDGAKRFFRTGDLGRRNEDGELEFLGRIGDGVAPPVQVATNSNPTVMDLQEALAKSGGVSQRERFTTWVLQAASLYLLAAIAAVPLALVFLLVFNWVDGTLSTTDVLGFAVLLTVCAWPALILFSVAAKWLIIGRIRPGEHKLWSHYYWRWWLVDRIVTLSGASAMNGTPLLPLYYRLMGARVGSGCSLNTVHCAAWDLVSIGAATSIGADTRILGHRVRDGVLRFGRVDVGNRCFVGAGATLGLNVCMGDESSVDDRSELPDGEVLHEGVGRREPAAPRTSPGRRLAFGVVYFLAIQAMSVALFLVPAVAFLVQSWVLYDAGAVLLDLFLVPVDVVVLWLYLAVLKRIVPLFGLKWLSDRLTTAGRVLLLPSSGFRRQRALADGLRILVPYYLVLYAVIMFSCALFLVHRMAGAAAVILAAPVAAVVFAAAVALAVVVIKELVAGRVNDLVDTSYESIMAPVLTPLRGTPFVAPFLRMMDREPLDVQPR